MTTLAPTRSAGSKTRERFWTDVPFTKAPTSASSGDIVLSGYASTWGLDRDEEMVAPNAFEKSLPAYLKKNPMLLWQHNLDWPIGSVTAGTTDENGLYITALVPDPGANAADWQKGAYTAIKTGVVRTFSIGGYMLRDVKSGPDGPVFVIAEVDLFEISCVSIPANADSIYEAAVKAVNGLAPRLSDKAQKQMEQILGLEPTTDPELRSMTEGQRVERYDLLAGMFKRVHDVDAPPLGSWEKIVEARQAGVNPLKVAQAATAIVRSFYMPEVEASKAGRAISSANKTKLQAALSAHDDIESNMIDAAESMKAAAAAHGEAKKCIKGVLGITDEEGTEDTDEQEDEPGDSPEKSAPEGDQKQLNSDLMQNLRDAGAERFGNPMASVYVDNYDPDQGFVVYCVFGPTQDDYLQVPYQRDSDGNVTLGDQVTPVELTTGYRPKGLDAPEDRKALSAPGIDAPDPDEPPAPDEPESTDTDDEKGEA